MYVPKSFCRWPSNVAYTVFSSKRDGTTSDTKMPAGTPGILPNTLVQVFPPSFVTDSTPSSVPA